MSINNPYNYSLPNNFVIKNKFENKQDVSQLNTANVKKSNNKFDQYKEQAIMTAPPEELTYMLYDGIVKFLKKAKIYMEQKDFEGINDSLKRAQDIITELNITLNMDYEISKNLRSLYDFMLRRLIDANIKKESSIVDEVLDLAVDLRDTWKEAVKLAKKES
ncbi:flagellar protein FliS [Caminicella sporogenes DSM 14501]|uniref:Flagellar protein FliS n=1 Tax=Caminicella sporogenes DSM 14501 TaxID=1121266 RepID=A0A1M6Q3W8_9FIRM|nr:flagellar export chaperone FliS [Caminicella sporogenes]SHK14833.1 flagellar protein FliS [Caminicella sporogenes DSM 14501]